jgi:CO/xanthine dehydrogenase Mo-binding subunit
MDLLVGERASAEPDRYPPRGRMDGNLVRTSVSFGAGLGRSRKPSRDLLLGRGIAYMHYKDSETHLALGMTVAMNKATGKISVRRMVCAHDCGLVANPDGIRNQIEGNLLQTLSRALHEEVTFDQSRVTSVNWARYPILTFPEVPVVQVVLVDRPDQPAWGGSEAASGPVAAALANAFFDATGVRLRSVRFTRYSYEASIPAVFAKPAIARPTGNCWDRLQARQGLHQ